MSFFEQLKRRKVMRVATGYLVAAWIAIQGASIALPAFNAPPWTLRVFILLFVLGFPLALVLSWALDVTPEGIKAEPGARDAATLGLIVLGLMLLGIGWYYFGQPYRGDTASRPGDQPAQGTQSTPQAIPTDAPAHVPMTPGASPPAVIRKEQAPLVPADQAATIVPDTRPAGGQAISPSGNSASLDRVAQGGAGTDCNELMRTLRRQTIAEQPRDAQARRQLRKVDIEKLRAAGCPVVRPRFGERRHAGNGAGNP